MGPEPRCWASAAKWYLYIIYYYSANSELAGYKVVGKCYQIDLSPLTGGRCLTGIGISGGKVNLVTSRLSSNLRLSSVHVPLQFLFFGGNVRVAFSHSNKLGTSFSVFFSDCLVLTEPNLQCRVS